MPNFTTYICYGFDFADATIIYRMELPLIMKTEKNFK